MSYGYQVCQTAHAVAQFAHDHPKTFKFWYEDNQSLVSLGIKNEDKLSALYEKIKEQFPDTIIQKFYEPDVEEYTSICLYAEPEVREYLSKYQLIGSQEKELVM